MLIKVRATRDSIEASRANPKSRADRGFAVRRNQTSTAGVSLSGFEIPFSAVASLAAPAQATNPGGIAVEAQTLPFSTQSVEPL
jgi:hypothetical protein